MQIIRFVSFFIYSKCIQNSEFTITDYENIHFDYFRFNWIVITWIERRKKISQNNCTLMTIIICCINSVQTNKSTKNEINRNIKIWKRQNIFQFKCHKTNRTWTYNSHISMSICAIPFNKKGQNLSIFGLIFSLKNPLIWSEYVFEHELNLSLPSSLRWGTPLNLHFYTIS